MGDDGRDIEGHQPQDPEVPEEGDQATARLIDDGEVSEGWRRKCEEREAAIQKFGHPSYLNCCERNRVVKLSENITNQSIARVEQEVLEKVLQKKPYYIWLRIESSGGNLKDALALMNKLETILRDSGEADNNPLVTEAFGICDSAASIILVGGTCRVASHPTTILIHCPKLSFAPGVAFNAEQLHHYADTLEQDQHDAAEYYFSNTKMDKEECKKLVSPRDPEKAFTCQQAKEKGIVDVVYGDRPVTPRLPPI